MKIVILDQYAANPGDISATPWQQIQAADGSFCEFVSYPRTDPNQVVERVGNAEIALTNKVVFDADTLAQLPTLRYIGVLATGYNVVDIEAASKQGIIVTNIPAYSTDSVAQLVFAHLLNITNHVDLHNTAVAQGKWQHSDDFCFMVSPQMELAGLTMGLVGLGNIGMKVARIALAMGMQVLAFTSKPQEQLPNGIRKAESLNQLFAQSDVLSLHCPLTPQTKGMVNTETLSLMKPSAILINTGRGPLIDEAALAEALHSGRIYAAAVDVLCQEAPRQGSPLIGLPNCFITPHIAWATQAARQRLWNIAIDNVCAFIAGAPKNVVSQF